MEQNLWAGGYCRGVLVGHTLQAHRALWAPVKKAARLVLCSLWERLAVSQRLLMDGVVPALPTVIAADGGLPIQVLGFVLGLPAQRLEKRSLPLLQGQRGRQH